MQKRIDLEDNACGGPPMSQAYVPQDTDSNESHETADTISRNTIQVNPDDEPDEEFSAEVVGFTIDGGPIIRFTNSVPDPLPNHTQVLGYCEDSRPIVICRRDAIQLMIPSPRPVVRSTIPSCEKQPEKQTS